MCRRCAKVDRVVRVWSEYWLTVSKCVTLIIVVFFFFNDTATTEIYTLSLHDALPIYGWQNA